MLIKATCPSKYFCFVFRPVAYFTVIAVMGLRGFCLYGTYLGPVIARSLGFWLADHVPALLGAWTSPGVVTGVGGGTGMVRLARVFLGADAGVE